ncbi:hypothetical protein ACSSS7_006617 [Eimeria intestinalis]
MGNVEEAEMCKFSQKMRQQAVVNGAEAASKRSAMAQATLLKQQPQHPQQNNSGSSTKRGPAAAASLLAHPPLSVTTHAVWLSLSREMSWSDSARRRRQSRETGPVHDKSSICSLGHPSTTVDTVAVVTAVSARTPHSGSSTHQPPNKRA